MGGIIERWSDQAIGAALLQDHNPTSSESPRSPFAVTRYNSEIPWLPINSEDGIGPNTILPPLPGPRLLQPQNDSDFSTGTPPPNRGDYASYIDKVFGLSGLESQPNSMTEDGVDEICGPSAADGRSSWTNGNLKGKSKMGTSPDSPPSPSGHNLPLSGRELGETVRRGIESVSSAAAILLLDGHHQLWWLQLEVVSQVLP